MIDLHSHILPSVDDGSKSIEESLAILEKLRSFGFTEIFLTPHYIENSDFSSPKEKNKVIFNNLKQSSKDIGITLHLANEVFLSENIKAQIKNSVIIPLLDKFILIELPFYGEIRNLDDLLHEISISGHTPILAHPERYDFVQKNPKIIKELKESGLLLQCNYGSLVGNYGKKAQKTIKYLLKNHLVDLMGTDVHRESSKILTNLPKSLKTLKRITKKDYYTYLTEAKALKS